MKRRDGLRALVVIAGLCAGVVLAQSPAGSKREAKPIPAGTKYEITGVVINSVSSDPVPHCHLTEP